MLHTEDSFSNLHILSLITIHYNYSVFDSVAFADGRLSEVSGILTDSGNGAPPYIIMNAAIAGFLVDSLIAGDDLLFSFTTNNLSLDNTGNSISSITVADPLEGWQYNISNGGRHAISLLQAGWHYLTITMRFANNATSTSYAAIKVKNGKITTNDPCDPEDRILRSDIAFQGLGEYDATTSNADYHIYYHHDATGSCERKIKKPIIILDGYDPLDNRSADQIYTGYLKYYDNNNNPHLAGDELRANTTGNGYDIIILNFPVLNNTDHPDRAQVPDDIQRQTGPNSFVTIYKKGRDCGTDYIERNAFLLVKLIQQVNTELATNSSSEKIVVIGPSMGGQISRYALAYMEKQKSLNVPNMDHNCRLWVSFDSPHWGANIPLSLQSSLHFLGYGAQQVGAQESYEQQINSLAGQQLLIEQVYSPNNGNTLRQNYMNSIANVGLANSGGYPMNLRKIALVNGSGAGQKVNTELQQDLGIGAYTLYPISYHVFTLNNYFLPSYNNSGTIAYTMVKSFKWLAPSFPHWLLKFVTYAQSKVFYNNNQRGSMDVVPGGMYDAQGESIPGIFDALDGAGAHNKQVYTYVPNHAFIPTISSLGFKNPNFSWYTRVDDRNLICTNEIPFDNYFVPAQNEPHVHLSYDNVPWLKRELLVGGINNGCPQICADNWPSDICDQSTIRLYLSGVPSNTSGYQIHWNTPITGAWSSSNLSLSNKTNTYADVTANFQTTANPNRTVTVTIENPCGADYTIIKTFNIISLTNLGPTVNSSPTTGGRYSVSVNFPAPGTGVSTTRNITWYHRPQTNFMHLYGANGGTLTAILAVGDTLCWALSATGISGCGTLDDDGCYIIDNSGVPQPTYIPQIRKRSVPNAANGTIVSPNPGKTAWNFYLNTQHGQPLRIDITDLSGRMLSTTPVESTQQTPVSCARLSGGTYLATVRYEDGSKETIRLQRE